MYNKEEIKQQRKLLKIWFPKKETYKKDNSEIQSNHLWQKWNDKKLKDQKRILKLKNQIFGRLIKESKKDFYELWKNVKMGNHN